MAPCRALRRGIAAVSLIAFLPGCHHSPATKPAPAPPTAPRAAKADGELYLPRGVTREKVMIECTDGYRMYGEYVKRERPARNMPGVIFLHDFASDRNKWYPLNYLTGARGYAVLSLDLRGHGGSPALTGNPPTRYDKLTPEDFQKMVQDVRNAVSFLAMKRDVAGNLIAIAGIGMGANIALLAAAEPWAESVRCVILLSPGDDYHGIDISGAAGKLKDKRVYIAVGKKDEYSYSSTLKIRQLIKGPIEILEDESDAHGVQMIGKGVIAKLPYWLNESIMAPIIKEENKSARKSRSR